MELELCNVMSLEQEYNMVEAGTNGIGTVYCNESGIKREREKI